jgi:tRNA A-37 threonylcarbamoyl transferase component Bud32
MSEPGGEDGGRITAQTVSVGDESYCPTCDESFDISISSCPTDGSRLVTFSEPDDDLLGTVLDDRFQIDARIGAGGMGTVYKARQSSIGRDVAVKVIHPARTRNRDAAKRFLREARLASKLTHPNTVVVHDVGQAPTGALYIAMELVRGETLRDAIRRGDLTLDAAIGIGAQLCDALAAAHRLGVIHRDLKPSNVMLVDGVVKVLDFGLAKSLAGDGSTTDLTDSNQIMGTPAYISPEMVRGDPLDERSDLYSLGCVLHEMIAGAPPFPAPNTSAVLTRHLDDAPPRLAAPPEIVDLVAALLAKKPEERPASAVAVKSALLAAAPRAAAMPAPGPKRWPLVAAAVVLLAGGAVTVAVALGGGAQTAAVADAAPIADAAPATNPVIDAAAIAPPIDAAATVELRFAVTPTTARIALPGGETARPGDSVRVPRGDRPIELRITAPGHRSAKRSITPSTDQAVELGLRPRRGAAGSGRGSGTGSGPPEVPFKID